MSYPNSHLVRRELWKAFAWLCMFCLASYLWFHKTGLMALDHLAYGVSCGTFFGNLLCCCDEAHRLMDNRKR